MLNYYNTINSVVCQLKNFTRCHTLFKNYFLIGIQINCRNLQKRLKLASQAGSESAQWEV